VQAEPLVETGAGPLGHHVANYHRAMMARAAESLDLIPRDEREISSVTLCISEARMGLIKERIVRFRAELLQLANEDAKPDRVVQINLQLFPLSSKGQVDD